MLEDCRIAQVAERLAVERFERRDAPGLEGCAHHLCRFFNTLEQMGLRVARAFENNIDDDQGWHIALINRLSIDIPGVRPALFPSELKNPLRELRAFRHVFVHAYELELDPEKLALLLKYAHQVSAHLPDLAEQFIRKVAAEQAIQLT
jgi:hypothetical protein